MESLPHLFFVQNVDLVLCLADQEFEDYVYFWKCVGRQLGIGDMYNLCSIDKTTSTSIVWEVTNQVGQSYEEL